MRSRRQFCRLTLTVLLAAAAERTLTHAQPAPPTQLWLPIVTGGSVPDDLPILGPTSGTAQQAVAWLAPRAVGYTPYDVAAIVDAYVRTGADGALDWFLALAQMAHETGNLASWWALRPRRNPAGIGVTGRVQPGTPDAPPAAGWTWDGGQWREGWSFPTWANDAVPAHIGRLLAYALRDDQADTAQQALIARALAYRPLPASYRGAATTIRGLNGRWAVPGSTYGQQIIALEWQIRDGV